MKKLLSLIALSVMAIGLASCDDKCDHNTNPDPAPEPEPELSIVGSWYDSRENEEIRFGEGATYYDRYANYERCAETSGRWEFDSNNSKLSYNYRFQGQTIYEDWTVKNLSELSFTVSSQTAVDVKLEKIVETYELEAGKTANIKFSDYKVTSYSSNNTRIASVTADGVIKAEGEKGVTYIKLSTSNGDVWVKVTVGDTCAELWHDYVALMGLDYNAMRKTLSRLGEPIPTEDEYCFAYVHNLHDVIDTAFVHLCPEEKTVEQVQLKLKQSVPEAELLAYMNARYYKMSEDDTYIYYTTLQDPKASKAIVGYHKTKKIVVFEDGQHHFHPHIKDLWTDFVPLFGSDKNKVKSAMDGYGYIFAMSDYLYSKDLTDYYYITNSSYAYIVGFVFNPDKQVSEFWVYLNKDANLKEIAYYLENKYTWVQSEDTQYTRVLYNDDKSVKVTWAPESGVIIYTKLTMKQHEEGKEILGYYYEGLGKTHDQILAQYGMPYEDEGGEKVWYAVYNQYVRLTGFYLNKNTQKCDFVAVTIDDGVKSSKILEYLNSKYTVFPKLTLEDGSQYAWTDGPSVAESTMGIVYYPKNKYVGYQPLGSAANVKAFGKAVRDIRLDKGFDAAMKAKKSPFLNSNKWMSGKFMRSTSPLPIRSFDRYMK